MDYARRRLAEKVDSLPEDQMLAATLAYLEGLSDARIAATLGKSEVEVETVRRQTEEALREYLPVLPHEAKRVEQTPRRRCRIDLTP